ncbi:LPXTG cell wall anchor domain-containing protein, partial [Streptomyces palmae]
TKPTDPPTDPTDPTDPSDPSDPSTNPPGDNGDGDEQGGSTCTVDLDGTDCGDNTGTDSAGSKPVQQGKAKEELAETGASETTYLLVGAATMIAGGVGFRVMPRLVSRGNVA